MRKLTLLRMKRVAPTEGSPLYTADEKALVCTLLLTEERVLWRGSSRSGLHLQSADPAEFVLGAFLILVGGVFALKLFPLGLLVPNLWAGLYVFFGRPFYESKQRSARTYVVTEESVAIISRWPSMSVQVRPRSSLRGFVVSPRRNGSVTIRFEAPAREPAIFRKFHGPSFAFEFLDDSADAIKALKWVRSSH